jgi:hypothetical protein
VTAIAPADWGRYREAGVTTFAVGPVTRPAVYIDRGEAELAADEAGGSYIEWRGCIGHQVLTAEAQAYAEAFADQAEPEAEP